MIARVRHGRLAGAVRSVTSKSCAHRALIGAALSQTPCAVRIDATNADIEATARCLTALGARVRVEGDCWLVGPIQPVQKALLDCGESGSTLRFLMPVAAALGTETTFVGHGKLPERPHTPLCDALRAHGALIDRDALPLTVSGRLQSGEYRLPGHVSSQYISGLLFALPLLNGDSDIVLTSPLASRGYVDLTKDALASFGIEIGESENGWRVSGGQTYRAPETLAVEGDWSAAAFFLSANATGSDVRVEGLNPQSHQGDRAMEDVMRALTDGSSNELVVDATDIPDLVPAIAAAAASVKRVTRVVGAARLRDKECDRLAAMRLGLGAMGADIVETDDGLVISGGALRGAFVSGFNDHRIVMALAVAALSAEGETTISDAEAVSKSYPRFWQDFKALGGKADVESIG